MQDDTVQPIPRLEFASDAVPAGTALAQWKSAIPEYEIEQHGGDRPGDFRVKTMAWFLEDMILNHGEVSALSFTRTTLRTRLYPSDTCTLALFTHGSSAGDVEGRFFTHGPGQLAAMDYGRPSAMRTTDNAFIILGLARVALSSVLPHLPDFHGRLLDGANGRRLTDHLFSLVRFLPALQARDVPDIKRATLALVGAALSELPLRTDPDRHAELRHLARRHIERHMVDADLTPDTLARSLQVSRTAVYNAFRPLGGISAYIQRRRLEAVRALLLSPEEQRPIGELASTFGFASPAHFAASFRAAFGQTPRALRRDPRFATVTSELSPDATAPERFLEWMRTLARH